MIAGSRHFFYLNSFNHNRLFLIMLNALTIDLEDYYHVAAFSNTVSKNSWERMESRIEKNLETILSILSEYQIKATFFTLGWIAERYPILIRAIVNQGHEMASHGYDHTMVNHSSRQSFREDVTRSKKLLEDITGFPIKGYRAPSFSINRSSLWALDILSEQGFGYDSSIFPIRRAAYGIPDAYRFPHMIELAGERYINEYPLSTISIMGLNFPIAGGGYLRLFPLRLITWGIKRVNNRERQPAIIYLHPWEFDPEQPRIASGLLSRLRHYVNLESTEKKFRHLVTHFKFTSIAHMSTRLSLTKQTIVPVQETGHDR